MALSVDMQQATHHPAHRNRTSFQTALSGGEGVAGVDAFLVTAGAGRTVDVAAGRAAVQGTTGYFPVRSTAIENLAIAANSSGLPRIDKVILRVYDSADEAAASDSATLEVVAGTATSGATLTNLSGVGASPASSVDLAHLLVPTGAATILAANIRDERRLAGGGSGTTPMAKLQRTTEQGTTSGVALDPVSFTVGTHRVFDTTSDDYMTSAAHAIRAPIPGYYTGSANLSFENVAGTGQRSAYITIVRQYGSNNIIGYSRTAGLSGVTSVVQVDTNGPIFMERGDYIQVGALQSSGLAAQLQVTGEYVPVLALNWVAY